MNIFGFDKQTMSLSKEIGGGITSFLTMAYILAVNPMILSATGMDRGAVFTATAVSAVVATLIMAAYAKLPFVLAPGMGLNAFFTYTVVLMLGYSWQFALTAVLIEGLIFILLTLTGLRTKLVDALPLCIQKAITPGIGLFIIFIGLQNTGVIVANNATIVALGDLHSQSVLLTMAGVIICAVLMVRKVRGALLWGILATSVIGAFMGLTHFDGFINMPPDIRPILFQFEWDKVFTSDMLICVLTLLFMDLFDTMGTLIGVCNRTGIVDGEERQSRLQRAFMADAIGTTAGAMLGTSTVTTFAESATGVEAGGRSGLTAFTAAVCFLLSLFFAPLFLAIPTQATSAVLILVGISMMSDLSKIQSDDLAHFIPAIICLAFMSLSYSISDGIIFSVLSFVAIHLFSGRWREVSLTLYLLAFAFVLKIIYL